MPDVPQHPGRQSTAHRIKGSLGSAPRVKRLGRPDQKREGRLQGYACEGHVQRLFGCRAWAIDSVYGRSGKLMAFSRRALLLGGVAAAAAVPVAMHLRWGTRSFTRGGFDAGPTQLPTDRNSWSNWSGLWRATPQKLVSPSSATEITAFLKTAPTPVRPVGSGHSFTALVPSGGSIIDISPIAGLIRFDRAAQTASLGAGTRLQHAARLLSAQGLAFPNLPDVDVQTLAGSFSTATHGTGRSLHALHNSVEGFELVTPGGDVLQVSATSNPDLFQAGKVSLGALGVMTRYDLKLEKAFNLRRQTGLIKIEKLLEQFDALSRKHRNFEAYYFPHTGYAAYIKHDIFDGEIVGRAPSEDDETLGALRQLRDKFGWWPWLRQKIAQSQLTEGPVEDTTDASWKLLSTNRPNKFNEMEYHLPVEKGVAILREVIERVEARKNTYYPIECRVTAADDAWLSPFNAGPRFSIAVHAAADEDYSYFFEDFEPLYLKNGGRPHWGKLNSLSGGQLREIYPKFADFNRLRKELDPQGKFVTPYMAKLWGET
jgi:FAD-linked oxidoreductase